MSEEDKFIYERIEVLIVSWRLTQNENSLEERHKSQAPTNDTSTSWKRMIQETPVETRINTVTT